MDTELYKGMLALLNSLASVILAMVTAILRILYDDKEKRWQRIWLEAALCGIICYGFTNVADYIGLSSRLNPAIGASVGFFGADYIRFISRKVLNSKLGVTK